MPAIPPLRRSGDHITGRVVYVDRFGNLITDIPGAWVMDGNWRCEIAGQRIGQISSTYAGAAPGALVALVSSAGTVEVALRNGNAAARLGVGTGTQVDLWPAD